MNEVRALLSHALPYRGALALLAILTIASSMVVLAIPWLAGQMLGSIVTGTQAQGTLITLLVGALVAAALISFATASQTAATMAQVLADLRQRVYAHVQNLPIGFHDHRGKGDTLALMTFEIAGLSDFLTGTLVTIPAKLLTTFGAVVLMFRIDPKLALIVPLLVPAFYLILKIVGWRLRGLAIALQLREAGVVVAAEEMLEMLPATKAFTREAAEAERYRGEVVEASRLRRRQGQIIAVIEPLIGLMAALAAIVVLLLAGSSVGAGHLSPPQLFSFIFYATLLTRPVGGLAHVYGEIQTARGTLGRLQSVFAEPTEAVSQSDSRSTRAIGAIRFDAVHFAYPERDQVLKGLTLDIAAGETVALVGPNGVGKTALINLLMRFYTPQSGTILLDGRDIADMPIADVRRQIGLVPQAPLLFNATIRDNIAFGAEAATDRQVNAAARLAQASGFIATLPEGMETVIGDRGVRLSGGQKQRIALARALLKDPPILVFDEATSMFDDEGEHAFIEACGEALGGRTVILVTHRPATLALADRIVTLEDGAVRPDEAGTAEPTLGSS
ncbi:MAG: ABC transporter ATP-binding protein [Sphingomicrobium sp.]